MALGTNTSANLPALGGGGAVLLGVGVPGVGPGTSSSSSGPSASRPVAATIDTVIQITAYSVYALLIVSFTIFRRIAAAVLIYALLCCVYATLLGMGLYFCPRLLGLLGVGGVRSDSPLFLRLVVCSSVSLLVFAAQTFCFAKKVVQSGPTSHKGGGPYWWFQYGALELLPGLLFLVLLHPKRIPSAAAPPNHETITKQAAGDQPYPPTSGRRTPPVHTLHKRTDSSDSKYGARKTPSPQPSRSPPRQHGHGSNTIISTVTTTTAAAAANKETAPLLASNSASNHHHRYGGVVMSGGHIDHAIAIDMFANQQYPHHHRQQQQQQLHQQQQLLQQQPGSERSPSTSMTTSSS